MAHPYQHAGGDQRACSLVSPHGPGNLGHASGTKSGPWKEGSPRALARGRPCGVGTGSLRTTGNDVTKGTLGTGAAFPSCRPETCVLYLLIENTVATFRDGGSVSGRRQSGLVGTGSLAGRIGIASLKAHERFAFFFSHPNPYPLRGDVTPLFLLRSASQSGTGMEEGALLPGAAVVGR